MPNSKHKEKSVRQDEVRRMRNKGLRSSMRTAIRRVNEAVEAANKDGAQSALVIAMKRIDKCAKINILHKNNASRRKSNLSRLVGKLS
ncbi:MAG: small subunit ribosomal protein S20 [Planctomycetota bacterium]|jgi:small subunit ribosomal protein S20